MVKKLHFRNAFNTFIYAIKLVNVFGCIGGYFWIKKCIGIQISYRYIKKNERRRRNINLLHPNITSRTSKKSIVFCLLVMWFFFVICIWNPENWQKFFFNKTVTTTNYSLYTNRVPRSSGLSYWPDERRTRCTEMEGKAHRQRFYGSKFYIWTFWLLGMKLNIHRFSSG